MPDAFGGLLATLPARGFEQLARGPGVGIDAGVLEGRIVCVLNVPDSQVERQVGPPVGKMFDATLEVSSDQVDTEPFPLPFAEHAIVVSEGVVLRKIVGNRPGHAVIAHDTKREQAVAIVAFVLGQVIPVKLAISLLGIEAEDFDVLLVEPFHGLLL
ncbi:hypothetical protein [Luteimonas notoginsengisoli]|uniref:Uncharacterized protein n=1 Tax=Luteimonas notoginsengisoli TaxID=1578200 RepID=A0ABV7UX24_9GAMM